ncbi:MAG: AraC family transcriptional regulator [Phycisphaerales bacterium]
MGAALHSMRMSGVVYTHSQLSAPWGMDLPPMEDCVMFHVVTEGACVLSVPGDAGTTTEYELRPGAFTLVPHGRGHVIASDGRVRPTPLFDLPWQRVAPRYEVLRHGGGGAATTLVCGAVRFDHPAARELHAQLPPVLSIEAWTSPHAEWMHSTLRLMATEAASPRPGGETIVTRLADILVIQAIRAWLEDAPVASAGWLAGLADERIGPVIGRVQHEPARAWTVASMAREASMSRSAFADRFASVMGTSPLQFVTRVRMQAAAMALREEDLPLAECATRFGYRSEAAFSRAFKRVIGTSPGAWQRSGDGATAI